jgi:hypothetical protein
MITLERTPEKDAVCRQTCKAMTFMHQLDCPYTQDRWKRQGVVMYANDFKIATPKEIRESVRA